MACHHTQEVTCHECQWRLVYNPPPQYVQPVNCQHCMCMSENVNGVDHMKCCMCGHRQQKLQIRYTSGTSQFDG